MRAGSAIRRLRAVLGATAVAAKPPLCYSLADEATRRRFLPEASADAVLSASRDGLRMRARGRDPFVYGPVTAVDLQAARLVRVTADFLGQRGHALKVYFSTDQAPLWCEEQSLEVKVPAAAGPVPLLFDFSTHERWAGRFLRLRIDLERMRRDDAEVELRTVELLPAPVTADIPAADPPANDRVVLCDEGGRPCVRISSEVVVIVDGLRRTSIPLTASRRIDGVEVRADFAIGPMEAGVASWTLRITPAAPLRVLDVASPVFGLGPGSGRPPALAVLPGVEMSATPPLCDLLPEPGLLSWRCAYLEADGAAVAVTWDDPEVTPRFAAGALTLHVPPRPGGRSLALAAVDWDATLTWSGRIVIASAGSRARALAAVAGPVPPAPACDAARVAAQAAAALDGPFRGPQGLTLPRLGAPAGEEYFEVRSCLSLLACSRLGLHDGEGAARAQVARYLEDAAAPVPLGIGLLWGLLFPECLDRALATLDRQARVLAASLRSDGTWPPVVPPGCHAPDPRPFSRSASAIAKPAALLLWAAACGLVEADRVEASLGRLRDPDLLPTGGQGWEFAPDVPELLGAADVADAFLLAYELELDPQGLDRAADWLMLGLTFFRLDGDPAFACCPALGVSRSNAGGLVWYSHAPDDQLDWRGLSCPWIGLRFADSLERFRAAVRRHGREEELAEVLRPMEAVSCGTLAHALTLARPHGSLLDGFDLRTGVETEPLHRAPVDVAWQALRLLSACPDPALARHGGLTAVGAGRFAVDGEALLFTAAIPGPQAILVAGPRGVSWQEVDGSSTVRIPPP